MYGLLSERQKDILNDSGDLKTSANCIIGITCAVCKSEEASKANVYGTYNVIYQGNTSNDNVVPVSITRN